MILHAPFVRRGHVQNPHIASPRTTLFYLENAQGEKFSCALAVRGPKNRVTYKAFDSFLDDYCEILPLGNAKQWRFRAMLAQWMDGIIYHSFLWCSKQGIDLFFRIFCIIQPARVFIFSSLSVILILGTLPIRCA